MSFLKKIAKAAATVKAAGFKETSKAEKTGRTKLKLEVTAVQVKAVHGLSKAIKGDDSGSESVSGGSESTGEIDSNLDNSEDGKISEPELDEETEAEREKRRLDPSNIRRLRSQLRTVEDILLCGENLEIGSDSDISDASQIWSEYGDEIQVDKEPKLIRWNPSQKKIAQRINVGSATTDKGHHPPPPQHQLEKKMIEIKRKKAAATSRQKSSSKEQGVLDSLSGGSAGAGDAAHADSAEAEEPAKGRKTPPQDAGLSFVPTGAGTSAGKGVYYLDFSNEFRKCLKKARDDQEREKGMNQLQKAETFWIKSMKADKDKTLQQKLQCLKLETLSKTGRHSSPRRTRSRGSPISSQRSSRKGSPARIDAENPNPGAEKEDGTRKESRIGSSKPGGQQQQQQQPQQKKAITEDSHDAMGTKWPKTMWDNTENYWRMIMAEEQFVITPANYNRQLDVEFRQRPIIVNFAQMTEAREKCLQWIAQNREYFSL